jgi:hypothetical protein
MLAGAGLAFAAGAHAAAPHSARIGSARAAHAAAPPAGRIGSAPRRPAGSRVLGPLAGNSKLHITIGLAPRNPPALSAYATAVSTSGPAYHHFLSVAQFARQFGPTGATIATVRSSLRAHGLRPGRLSPNGLSISVSADAHTMAKAFSTSFDRIAVRGGRTAYANTTAPRVDAQVAGDVQAIIGLDSISHARPLALPGRTHGHSARVAPSVATAGPTPCSTARAVADGAGAHTADQIATAYGFDGLYRAGDLGAGQTVALYELEPNLKSDISAYQSCYGTSTSVTYAPVGAGAGTGAGQGEAALDIETVIGLAPAASLIVYQGLNTTDGAYDTYNAIVSQNRARVISTSWGECELNLGATAAQAESTLFAEAAVQGQSVLAASGDEGAQDCYDPATQFPTTPAVDDPASQPFVTGVGGTTLTGRPRLEAVWNNEIGASGGGDSSLWPMPAYQSGAPGVVNLSSAAGNTCGGSGGFCREVPDVSLDADPDTGYVTYWNGNGSPQDITGWGAVGGTSAGAPGWAAMFALANASTACAGAPIGFANPALYLATAGLNDITAGNNDWTATNGGVFAAGTGYDQATGLGTPIAPALSTALCGDTVSIVDPGAQTSLAGRPDTAQLRAGASSGQTVSFQATGLPPGLSIDGTGLISGTPTTTGAYQVTASAADASGTTGRVTFIWTVAPATITLAGPGQQSGRMKAAASLQIHATDDNGAAISYTAAGLPRGLGLSATTGRISGTLAAAGTSTVTVTARATGAPSRSASFRWSVAGPPSWSRASLGGIAAGRPVLRLGFASGIDAPALRTISLKLSAGLGFARSGASLRQGVSVTGAGGRRLSFTAKLQAGRLTIALLQGATQPQIAITTPAIQASRQFSRRVRAHHQGRVPLSVSAQDTARLVTSFSLRLRPA